MTLAQNRRPASLSDARPTARSRPFPGAPGLIIGCFVCLRPGVGTGASPSAPGTGPGPHSVARAQLATKLDSIGSDGQTADPKCLADTCESCFEVRGGAAEDPQPLVISPSLSGPCRGRRMSPPSARTLLRSARRTCAVPSACVCPGAAMCVAGARRFVVASFLPPPLNVTVPAPAHVALNRRLRRRGAAGTGNARNSRNR